MNEIWSNLPRELSEKIVAHVGKKSLFRQIYGGIVPLSCSKIIQNVKIKEILNGRRIIFCQDLLNEDKSCNIDLIVSLFEASFHFEKWSTLFELTIKICVYIDQVSTIAEKIAHHLNILKKHVHDEMQCIYILDGCGPFPIDFENCDEFVKFFIFIELYSSIDANILKDEFFQRINFSSYYDLYEFLPNGVDKIRQKISLYTTPFCQHCCCCFICGWFYGSPWLSKLVHDLIVYNRQCKICSDFSYKFFRYMQNQSLYSYLIGGLKSNQENTKVPTEFLHRVQSYTALQQEWHILNIKFIDDT